MEFQEIPSFDLRGGGGGFLGEIRTAKVDASGRVSYSDLPSQKSIHKGGLMLEEEQKSEEKCPFNNMCLQQ